MPLNVVLVAQRQSPNGMALSWSAMEGVASYQVFVSGRKLSPEELEAARLLGGTDDCLLFKVGSEVHSVVDDLTPQGEARHYGVAMVFDDGAVKAARFKAVPDGGTAESFHLSAVGGRKAASAPRPAAPGAPRPGSAPATGGTGSYRIATAAPAARAPDPAQRVAEPEVRAAEPARGVEPAQRAAAPGEDPLEARKRAQREARARVDEKVIEPRPFPSTLPVPSAASEEDPTEARRRQQQQAAARAARDVADPGGAMSAEPPPPPSAVPLDGPLEVRMQGATQTWDGLRISWEREPRVVAYEVIASDHQIFGDELAEALAGKADFTTAVALPPSTTAVIDNVTSREARGWYAVLARFADGRRAPLRFEVGDAATSGKLVAPFLNPNRTGELRSEVEDLIAQAQEQWGRWKGEQDGGARREARRLIADALLIWPNHPAAKRLSEEMG